MTRFAARTLAVSLALLIGISAGAVLRAQAVDAAAPILLVTGSGAGNPFGAYLGEILRAEGLNAYNVAGLASLNAATLSAAPLVVLAETPLTDAQAALFAAYVASGGRLVAMRPDPRLYATLGLTGAASDLNGGYLGIAPGSSSGGGLTALTLPLNAPAARYSTASGAEVVARLYSNRTSVTGFPAVVRHGRTASWAFDLARSVVYTRQGNPANAGVDRDGLPPLRTNDVFYEAIDLDRVPVPHADIQMRLFARVVSNLLADHTPLPRLWYFAGASRTQLILTGDSHSNTQAEFDTLIDSVEDRGGRISIYVPRFVANPSPASVAAWRANGHEVGLHPYGAADGKTLSEAFQINRDDFVLKYGNPSATSRNHQVEWQGWVGGATAAAGAGVGLDTSFYTWGPSVRYADDHQAHGYINGSGQPMKFVDQSGALIDVYQQVTALVDEQLVWGSESEGLTPDEATAVSRQLIDDSQAGYYAAIMTQFHVDYFSFGEVRPWAEATMDYAASLDIPMWTAERWLAFTQARHDAELAALAWDDASGQFSFTMSAPTGADGLGVLLPASFGGAALGGVLVDGAPAGYTMLSVNGRQHALVEVSAAAHSFNVGYGVAPMVATPTVTPAPPSPTPTDVPPPPTVTPVGLPAAPPRTWLPFVATAR